MVSRDSVSIQMNFELTENLTTSLPTLDTVVDQSSPVLAPMQSGFNRWSRKRGLNSSLYTLGPSRSTIGRGSGSSKRIIRSLFQESLTIQEEESLQTSLSSHRRTTSPSQCPGWS